MTDMNNQNKKLSLTLWILMGLQNLAAAISIFRFPSEDQSALLLGYSAKIIFIFSLFLLLALLFIFVAWLIYRGSALWQKIAAIGETMIASNALLALIAAGMLVIFSSLLAVQWIASSPAANEAVILKIVLQRFGIPMLVIQLTIVECFLLLFLRNKSRFTFLLQPINLSVGILLITVIYFIAVKSYANWMWLTQFRRMENYLFILPLYLLIWAVVWHRAKDQNWYKKNEKWFLSLAIFLFSYSLYRQTAQWVNWYITPSKTYWHELANAFLQGRLYLVSPSTTHDLTLYQGHWYVPNPPLPALILMPVVAILGVEHINMVLFSIFWASLTIVFFFHLLEEASNRKLIQTDRGSNLWLTTLFAFGTCFWWLAVMGRMWFLSQTMTVFFIIVAVLLVIRKSSPWLSGFALGLAILARPNVFTIWPFLLAVAVYYLQEENQKISLKAVFSWAIQSAIPVILCVVGLLFYNYIRFDDFFDFGYVTITTAEWLTEQVTKYGMFNPHFFLSNFKMMFLTIPQWELQNSCPTMVASRDGYSLWIMTPALFYLLKRNKKNWWTAGAWISLLLTIALLLFYHNNGAWQLGYRYLMDFIVPAFLLIASAIQKKMSLLLKVLIVLSIISNFLGVLWWFNIWFC